MSEIVTTLEKFADETEVSIQSFDSNGFSLELQIASRGNEKWMIKAKDVIHLDLSPSFILGKANFGNLNLLPEGYVESRNFDYGGDLANYRVIRFTDVDDKKHFIVLYGEEEVVKVGV